MKIGYCRCSIDQNTARQEKILKDLGCKKIYPDMVSGKSRDRPGLQEMLSFIREGDILYVESISRLARSTHDLLDIIDELQQKKVSFVAEFGKTERLFRFRGMPFRFSGTLSRCYLLKFGLRMFLPLNSKRYALLTSLSRQASA